MIPVYAELLNDLTQKVNDENISPEEKISITKDLLHEIKINKITNFFLNNEDRIRRFYGDLENLKSERFINIISPKAAFNFFNEYLEGMMKYINTPHDINSIDSIKNKSNEFIEKIFTKDPNLVGVSVNVRSDSLYDYIWFHNIGVQVIEDVIERFEKSEKAYDVDSVLLYCSSSELSAVNNAAKLLTDNGKSVLVLKSIPKNLKYKQLLLIRRNSFHINLRI